MANKYFIATAFPHCPLAVDSKQFLDFALDLLNDDIVPHVERITTERGGQKYDMIILAPKGEPND